MATETTPTTTTTPETPAVPANATTTWNGELASLDSEPWYTGIDETIRTSIRSGIENKLKNFETGYQAKFREVSEARKAFEAEKEQHQRELAERQEALKNMLYGSDEPNEWEAKYKELEPQLNEWKNKYEELSKAQYDQLVNAVVADLEKNAPDIWANDTAFERYIDLLEKGISRDEAMKMVKAILPAAEPEVKPTKAELAMSGDTQNTKRVSTKYTSWEEQKKAFLRGE